MRGLRGASSLSPAQNRPRIRRLDPSGGGDLSQQQGTTLRYCAVPTGCPIYRPWVSGSHERVQRAPDATGINSTAFGGNMIRGTVHQGHQGVAKSRAELQAEAFGKVRQFDTGATRDTDQGKVDYEGFLSPYALKAFGEYMDRHRHLPDGSIRASDNWQNGLPMDVYMKSMWRHFFDVWSEHRGVSTPAGLKENLCALKFNVDGMLHELVKAEHDHTPGAGYAMPLADLED